MRKCQLSALLIVVAAMTGCSAQKNILAGDGESAIQIDCSGRFKSWDMCYDKLATACGEMGFEILRSSLDGNEIRAKESDQRTILGRCKK